MTAVIAKLSPKMKTGYVVESSGNLMLPAMRCMYGNLFKSTFPSKRERNEQKKRWSITGLIPGVADLSLLKAEIDRIVADNLTEAKRKPNADGSLPYVHPLLKTAGINSIAGYAEDYAMCVRLGTREFDNGGKRRPAPQVVDAKSMPVDEKDEPDEIYNGRWFRATVNPYWYPAHEGKPGVSLGLVNVQLLFNDDSLAGGKADASTEFESVDIGEDEEVAGDYE